LILLKIGCDSLEVPPRDEISCFFVRDTVLKIDENFMDLEVFGEGGMDNEPTLNGLSLSDGI
jgi:hypothetical protein